MFSQDFIDFIYLTVHLPITLFSLIYNFGYTDQQRAMIARNENRLRQKLFLESATRDDIHKETKREPKFIKKEFSFKNISDVESTDDSDW